MDILAWAIQVNEYKNSYGPGYDLVFDIYKVTIVKPGIRKISGMPGMAFGGSMSDDDIVFYVPANVLRFQVDRLKQPQGDVFILRKWVPWYLSNRQVIAWKANIFYPENEIKVY